MTDGRTNGGGGKWKIVQYSELNEKPQKVYVLEMSIICMRDLIFPLQTAIFCNMDHECVFKKVLYLSWVPRMFMFC